MTDATCPSCGAEATGNFCARCGSALSGRECPSCGKESRPGDRFCTTCGAPLGAGGAPAPAAAPTAAQASGGGSPGGSGDGSLGWWVAGLLLVALILFLLVPVLSPERGRSGGDAPGVGAPSAGGSGAGSNLGAAPNVDLSSMTPRQAADRLFDRVMRAAESGDSTQARQFLPMAIAAYERARPLDLDGLFHLSVLQRTAGQLDEALSTAEGGLEEEPDHLLLLSAAAEAARELDDTATARERFSHLLDVYDSQVESDREDYQVHARLLPTLREDARGFLEGS